MKLRTATCLAFVIPVMVLFTVYAENPSEGQKIKDHVRGHYKELQDDLHQGDGVSLTSLLSLLHTRPEEKDETIKRLRALSEAYPTPSEFADRVPDFMHQEQVPAAAPAMSAVSESDLEKLFGHMKYKTRLHLSLLNGDEIDGTFSSFNRAQGIIWLYPPDSSSMFGKKSYALHDMKNVTH
jgi:hypothetical protein